MIRFIEGTDNKVIITSDGRVFKRRKMYAGRGKKKHTIGWSKFREVKPWLNGWGYLQVTLNETRNTPLVHRLVAKAFIPKPPGATDVDHIDGDKTNNRIENLRWVSHKENCNNPNTKWKGHRSWTNIQGFNPKTNFRTPIFVNLREASTWSTPEGKKINPVSLANSLKRKITYKDYLWTAKLVTGEEYRKLLE